MDFETRSRVKPELNMAPLIDVVFLLLIFFMLTSSMIRMDQIELDLPGSSSSTSLDKKLINLSLLSDGTYYLDQEKISEKDLISKLLNFFKTDSEQAIILSVDQKASAQQMVTAMDLIRNSGGSNISLATKKQEGSVQ